MKKLAGLRLTCIGTRLNSWKKNLTPLMKYMHKNLKNYENYLTDFYLYFEEILKTYFDNDMLKKMI